ncbi:MAG TPA: alcohol dehydrogenase catalytic domain-containing protein [Solirubrobacteraceae bacterium]|jgi:alcohol dehydrogenase|nr:alcohol dehydrogenase catalytic domain-containing protein [Solirubrobacteraceae bacterium]
MGRRAAVDWARHAGHLLRPSAAPAAGVAFERDGAERARRLADAARGRVRERSAPKPMRALEMRPGGRARWRAVPALPPPGPLAAVVRPLAVATCDLDRALALGVSPFPLPLCFGHECVAEVVAVGDRVSTVTPGERVIVPFQISCGACPACREGRTGNCAAVPPISMYGFGLAGGHWGGAVTDELAVPFADGMLVALPEGIEPEHAASVADNVADAWRHVGPHLPALLERDPAVRVVIVAALRAHVHSASVPLYAGLIARALGARDVLVIDARPEVRAQAADLGLEPVEPQRAGTLAPTPLVVDASTSNEGLQLAIALTAPDGTCSSVGGLYKTATLPFSAMYGRNATLHVGRTHARAVIPHVLELMREGRLRPELVTTLTAPLDDAPAALAAHVHSAQTKTILTRANG